MSKIQKLKVETLGTYSLMDKVNELVDEVNTLKEKLTKSQTRESFKIKEKDGPGEIGWNGGEFYKD